MEKRGLWRVMIFSLCWGIAGLALAQKIDWDKGERDIKRLSPQAFPAAPAPVRAALERMGCTIPQIHASTEPRNLISGSFAKPGQIDWAAICSRNGESSVVVFWGGSPTSTTILNPTKDRDWLQGEVGDIPGNQHFIAPVSVKGIKGYMAESEKVAKEMAEAERVRRANEPAPPASHDTPGMRSPYPIPPAPPAPPARSAITHGGIVEGNENASTIHYYHDGKWVDLPGGTD